MQKFIYKGPINSGVSIDGVDYLLYQGKPITLPEDNDYVKGLVAQEYLEIVIEKPVIAENINPVIASKK